MEESMARLRDVHRVFEAIPSSILYFYNVEDSTLMTPQCAVPLPINYPPSAPVEIDANKVGNHLLGVATRVNCGSQW